MMKLLKILGCGILILCIVLFLIVIYFYTSSQSKYTGSITLSGLKKSVTIHRDQYGIPHIKALTDEDAFFALGYVHAQDRFWQMEFQKHIAQGTLSELFGEATIEQDKFLRTFGFYRAAISGWDALSAQTKNIINSYTAGINAFIDQDIIPLPMKLIHYKPQHWSNIDSIAWQKMMAWDLQSSWKEKIENFIIAKELGESQIPILLPPYPSNAPTILNDNDLANNQLLSSNINGLVNTSLNQDSLASVSLNELLNQTEKINHQLGFVDAVGKGSNNWVVSGQFTKSKKPILASDPHLGLSSPLLWYLADIQTPTFHTIGATIPGLPAVVIGHNDHIAWGITNGCVDVQDLYIESDDSTFKIINEVIKVKDSANINFPVKISTHGPIISDLTNAGNIGKHIALKWTALMPDDTTMQSFIELNYAKNWDGFVNALKYFITPSQNFIYADTDGNIGYYLTGKIPIREGWNGSLPINASENLEWKKFIPFSKLPHAYNPPDGYIISANNPSVSKLYPYPLTFRCGIAPYRAERIIDLIKNNHSLSNADMERIQNDTQNYLWRDLRPLLLKTQPLDQNSKNALYKLTIWDGNMDLQSEEATIFAFWYRELSRLTPALLHSFSEWPEPLFIKSQLETDGVYCKTQENKNCADFLSYSLKQATKNLPNKQLTWGGIHKAYFEEAGLGQVKYLGWIWNRKISTPGDSYTINVGTYHFNNMIQIEGAGYRQIIDLNNMNNSKYIQALGQSDNVFSRHYDNQMLLWRDGKYLPMSSKSRDWGQYKTLKLEPSVKSG